MKVYSIFIDVEKVARKFYGYFNYFQIISHFALGAGTRYASFGVLSKRRPLAPPNDQFNRDRHQFQPTVL
jgi:hypothetical protein